MYVWGGSAPPPTQKNESVSSTSIQAQAANFATHIALVGFHHKKFNYDCDCGFHLYVSLPVQYPVEYLRVIVQMIVIVI